MWREYLNFFHQVALYCRQELNLRTTSNFLLAFCCLHKSCKIFVLKYFKATVVLPSDWMAIADFIQVSGTQGQFSKGLCCILLRAANRSRLVAFFNWSFRPLWKFLIINQWICAFCEFGKMLTIQLQSESTKLQTVPLNWFGKHDG